MPRGYESMHGNPTRIFNYRQKGIIRSAAVGRWTPNPPSATVPADRSQNNTPMNAYLALTIAIFAEVVATSALKACESFTRLGPSLLVVAGYCIAFLFLSITVRSVPLGIAYAIWSGLGSALIVLVAWLIFKQPIDAAAILGIALIIAGCVVLNVFSKASAH